MGEGANDSRIAWMSLNHLLDPLAAMSSIWTTLSFTLLWTSASIHLPFFLVIRLWELSLLVRFNHGVSFIQT